MGNELKELRDMNGKYIKIGDYLMRNGRLFQCRSFNAHGNIHAVCVLPTSDCKMNSVDRPADEFVLCDGKFDDGDSVNKKKLLKLADAIDYIGNHGGEIPLWLIAIKIRAAVYDY